MKDRIIIDVEGGWGIELRRYSKCGRVEKGVGISLVGSDGGPEPGVVLSKKSAEKIVAFLTESIPNMEDRKP